MTVNSGCRTHDLAALASLLGQVIAGWSWDRAELEDLTDAAVDYRYPGAEATRSMAEQAFERCERLRVSLLSFLDRP